MADPEDEYTDLLSEGTLSDVDAVGAESDAFAVATLTDVCAVATEINVLALALVGGDVAASGGGKIDPDPQDG